MSKVTGEQIRASLKQCMDPEIPISIVDLGLIYGIDISEKNDVNIKMTMTTKGCPLHDTMVDDVKRYTRKVSGVNNVNVDICLLYTSPSPRDVEESRMPSSA